MFCRKYRNPQDRAVNCCHARSGNELVLTILIEHTHVGRDISGMTIQTPQRIATEAFSDAHSAIGRLEEVYERNTRFLRDRFEAYLNGETLTARVRACYPFVRITTQTHARLDSR